MSSLRDCMVFIFCTFELLLITNTTNLIMMKKLLLPLLFLAACSSAPTGPNAIELSNKAAPISKKVPMSIRSAFFGLDDALPATSRAIWSEAPGKDGMPVVFSAEIDPTTLQESDFVVRTKSGKELVPGKVTLRPANEAFELRTVLLMGDLGDAKTDPPIEVEVVDDLRTRTGEQYKGYKKPVTPLAAGPFIAYAEHFKLGADYPHKASGRGCDCPKEETKAVVRLVWAGGITSSDGKDIGDREASKMKVKVQLDNGEVQVVKPFRLADLNDADNNLDLCLNVAGKPLEVAVGEKLFQDPNGDLNPYAKAMVVGRWDD